MSAAPEISVCIVTARRPALLDACLASLRNQAAPPAFELLVGCNGDSAAAEVVRRNFPDATIGLSGPMLPGMARNFLVARARGRLLLFLDDDVVADRQLLRRLAELGSAWPDVAVFGGPNETPPGSTRFQIAQGAVLASLIGSGPVRRRYGRHRAGPADERYFTLCNLAVRRCAMLPFPADLVCAEESVVLAELSRRGAAMRYDPDLVVFHERRPTIGAFLAQVFKYGRGRGQALVRAPATFRPTYAAPVAVVIYLVLLPALAPHGWPWLLPLLAYAAVVAAGALRVAWTLRHPSTGPVAAALLVGLHVCYGTGVLAGLAPRAKQVPRPEFEWMGRAAGTN